MWGWWERETQVVCFLCDRQRYGLFVSRLDILIACILSNFCTTTYVICWLPSATRRADGARRSCATLLRATITERSCKSNSISKDMKTPEERALATFHLSNGTSDRKHSSLWDYNRNRFDVNAAELNACFSSAACSALLCSDIDAGPRQVRAGAVVEGYEARHGVD